MTTTRIPSTRTMLNKVPEVTVYFWLIKVLCTTVGETFADNLNEKLNLGLTNTTYLMGAALLVSLAYQFRARRYVPGVYWLTVVLISVVGTLITDNLTDNLGVPLVASTIGFAVALVLVFAGWYAREGTLSIHSIDTTSREAWYWLAILFTFALGTAAGDLTAERLNVGYGPSAVMFAAVIAVIAITHYALQARLSASEQRHRSNAVLAFWLAYILTRPLGASIGDFMSQPHKHGGLGLGTVVTSAVFLGAILALVAYLTVSKVDRIPETGADPEAEQQLEPAGRGR